MATELPAHMPAPNSTRLDWARLALCGLIAGGAWTLLSAGFLALIGQAFMSTVARGQLDGGSNGASHLLLFGLNLAMGVWALWLYAILRRHYGKGWRTAIATGCAWWIIISLQSIKWAVVVALPAEVALAPALCNLAAVNLAMLVGAGLYEKR